MALAFVFGLTGFSAAEESSQITWSAAAPLPYRVQEIYPVVHQGKIYVAGGLSPDVPEQQMNISDQVWAYDPELDRWVAAPSLPEPRHHPFLVSYEDAIYAFGGFIARDGGRWHNSSDVLRLVDGGSSWEKIGSMPSPQAETLAVVLKHKIHLASGRSPRGSQNARWGDQIDVAEHRIYDPTTGSWAPAPALDVARNSASGVRLGGAWHVIAGRTVAGGNLPTHELYDLEANSWTRKAPLPQAQGGLAAAALHGKIYVFGGEYFDNGGGVYEEVWEYTPETDRWRHVSDMPVPRHGLGAVTLGDAIYVVGGATEAGGAGTSNRVSVFTLTEATSP